MTEDELIRWGVGKIKDTANWTTPPLTLPPDSFIEAAVRDIVTATLGVKLQSHDDDGHC